MTDKPNYSLKDLLNELKEKEKGCGKDFIGKNSGSLNKCELHSICPNCQAEISALKKGISACEEALSQRNKEILEIIDKWANDKRYGDFGWIHKLNIQELKEKLTNQSQQNKPASELNPLRQDHLQNGSADTYNHKEDLE